jgi:hypothetical protein
MSDVTIDFFGDTAAAVEPAAEAGLSLRAKACVIIGLALAAWVPVLLPFFLFFHR